MKICLLGPFPPFRGGIAQFNSRLAETFERGGHSVRRVNFRTLYPGLLFPGKTQYEPPGAPSAPESLRLLHPTAFLSWPATKRAVASLKCDAAVVQWWHPFFAPCLSASLPDGLPTAAVCHNLTPHEGFPLSGILTRRFMEKRAQIIVVHGKDDGERARRWGKKVVDLFHPIYDQYRPGASSRAEAREMLGLDEDRVVLLFFGLVRKYKGLDLLIKAMESLPENHVLLAVGENYGREDELEALSAPLGNRFIRHREFVPDSRVGLYFQAADIVVLPYVTATQSGVAQIALAFRKPMVVTDVGGLAETVKPGCTGEVAVPDPESLADAVIRCGSLLSNPGLSERVARHAARFSWELYAGSLLEGLQ